MAHKKAGGSTQLGRDSKPKYLGVKLFGGQVVKSGEVIIRQRGTKFHPGKNVRVGSDDTIYAVKNGKIEFQKKQIRNFDGNLRKKTFVSVV